MYLVVWEGQYAEDGITEVHETYREAQQSYENLKAQPDTRFCYIALIDQSYEPYKEAK